jgi:hypothetical protein
MTDTATYGTDNADAERQGRRITREIERLRRLESLGVSPRSTSTRACRASRRGCKAELINFWSRADAPASTSPSVSTPQKFANAESDAVSKIRALAR